MILRPFIHVCVGGYEYVYMAIGDEVGVYSINTLTNSKVEQSSDSTITFILWQQRSFRSR